ncbi:acyl-CoA dehydrogenase [Haloarcula onubensis]|uniref:Acyl-CoA dehydrogenase n=1 Tax=Haloarcula onubensis TaxID=2950539 RepID=A0ABU2FVT2_9EURY|nr:acyl-CoA dehydrogenase [Halomicroarcula sp. S3CR25-11]MDS0284554.1 acyl-CoA dehydrogenase [Halomicroarcula sp. S3CR25-11]
MTNFKSGSGNLDFDAEDASEAESTGDTSTAGATESGDGASEQDATGPAADRSPAATDDPPASTGAGDGETYPYFVRRNNVGDERDTRLEIHVRDKVAEGEAQFRHALAAELGASDVSKTDAREFALLAAFRYPERVAELMREEGFDSLG